MEAQTFAPGLFDLYATMAICVLGIVAMVYLAVRAGKRKGGDPRRRVLLPMLAYFAGLLFLMALLGAFWTTFRYPTVAVDGSRLTIDGVVYPVPGPGSVRLEQVGRGIGSNQTVLLLQTRDRRSWAFPADRYDVQALYRLIRSGQQ